MNANDKLSIWHIEQTHVRLFPSNLMLVYFNIHNKIQIQMKYKKIVECVVVANVQEKKKNDCLIAKMGEYIHILLFFSIILVRTAFEWMNPFRLILLMLIKNRGPYLQLRASVVRTVYYIHTQTGRERTHFLWKLFSLLFLSFTNTLCFSF